MLINAHVKLMGVPDAELSEWLTEIIGGVAAFNLGTMFGSSIRYIYSDDFQSF